MFNNLFGSELDITVGQFQISDPLFKRELRLTKDDYYIYDEKQYAIIGQSTKTVIQLGDEVTVKVKKTDLERKHLDFTLISHE